MVVMVKVPALPVAPVSMYTEIEDILNQIVSNICILGKNKSLNPLLFIQSSNSIARILMKKIYKDEDFFFMLQ